jgi:hypothetical protein
MSVMIRIRIQPFIYLNTIKSPLYSTTNEQVLCQYLKENNSDFKIY